MSQDDIQLYDDSELLIYPKPCAMKIQEITCAEFSERGGISRLLAEYEQLVGPSDQESNE